MCFVGVGNRGKHEGMIIKNVNWLQKNPVFFYFFYPPPPSAPWLHLSAWKGGGGGI